MEVIQSITPYDFCFSPVSEIEELKKKLKTGNIEVKAEVIEEDEKKESSLWDNLDAKASGEELIDSVQNLNLNNNNNVDSK
jgi:hypothetical protein